MQSLIGLLEFQLPQLRSKMVSSGYGCVGVLPLGTSRFSLLCFNDFHSNLFTPSTLLIIFLSYSAPSKAGTSRHTTVCHLFVAIFIIFD